LQTLNVLGITKKMRQYQFLVALLVLWPLGATAQTKSLADLERTAKELTSNLNPFQDNDRRIAYQADFVKLVDSDALKTGDEFQRAAAIVNSINATFRDAEMRHELTFVAMTLGNGDAAKRLASTWDQFLLATGRRQHMGTSRGFPGIEDETYAVNPTVLPVRTLLTNPVKGREDAKKLTPNKELNDLVEADQKAREGDFSKMTNDQMKEMYKADIGRRKRLKAILEKIPLMTAKDYAAAALVMQHGSRFDDYALAHELALCATILDPQEGRQLIALTWDRMLNSAGYLQRVGTQYHGVTLAEVDSNGFSDTMRTTLGRLPLAQIPKKLGN